MKQKIPKPNADLIGFAGRVANGAMRFGAEIGLSHNTENKFRDDIAAARNTSFDYSRNRSELRHCYDRLYAKVEELRAVATITREILKLRLGKSFNGHWPATGFKRSLAMPRSAQALVPLVDSLSTYLAENPGLEVPALNATSAFLSEINGELRAMVYAAGQQQVIVDQSLLLRNQHVTRLRKRIRDLI
jgi:hypothetical protein